MTLTQEIRTLATVASLATATAPAVAQQFVTMQDRLRPVNGLPYYFNQSTPRTFSDYAGSAQGLDGSFRFLTFEQPITEETASRQARFTWHAAVSPGGAAPLNEFQMGPYINNPWTLNLVIWNRDQFTVVNPHAGLHSIQAVAVNAPPTLVHGSTNGFAVWQLGYTIDLPALSGDYIFGISAGSFGPPPIPGGFRSHHMTPLSTQGNLIATNPRDRVYVRQAPTGTPGTYELSGIGPTALAPFKLEAIVPSPGAVTVLGLGGAYFGFASRRRRE